MTKDTNKKTEEMFAVGAHYGYSPSTSHPKMKPFIAAVKNGISIFDLDKTNAKLDAAKEFLKTLGKEKKSIFFVGTKKESKGAIQKHADSLSMPYVNERWLGGILTNFNEIKKRLEFLNSMVVKKASGDFEKYTKKERLLIDEKIIKMKRFFDGMATLKGFPAALIVVDSKKEKNSIAEAKQMKVPIISLMNSDCDIRDANYVIPGNDVSVSSINYFLDELVKAYKSGISE